MTNAKNTGKKKAPVFKKDELHNLLIEKLPHCLIKDDTKLDARFIARESGFSLQYVYWSLKKNRLSKNLADTLIKHSEEYLEYETCSKKFKPLSVNDCWKYMT